MEISIPNYPDCTFAFSLGMKTHNDDPVWLPSGKKKCSTEESQSRCSLFTLYGGPVAHECNLSYSGGAD
jgi:hypothetical protein